MNIRIGQGIDFHKLETGRDLYLGGILVPSDKGALAHSDGDVLIHAICDALLGAANLKDIGFHFPDSSNKYKNIDSKILLKKTVKLISSEGFSICNIDTTVCLELPKLAPYIDSMRACLAKTTGLDVNKISVKATTTEKMGVIGLGEGIAALASVLLKRKSS